MISYRPRWLRPCDPASYGPLTYPATPGPRTGCRGPPPAKAGLSAFASLPRSFIRGEHFAEASVRQRSKAYEGKPLTIPAEAAAARSRRDPKAECLEWHRQEVFNT